MSAIAATILSLAVTSAQDKENAKGAPPPDGKAKGFGRGARPKGPAGPLPRLSDGKPDLS